MATGITKIDIYTINDVELVDGTILNKGSIIKFGLEFPLDYKGFKFDIFSYRNEEDYRTKPFEKAVLIKGFVQTGEILLEDRFSWINIHGVYHLIVNYINEQFDIPIAEVKYEIGELISED